MNPWILYREGFDAKSAAPEESLFSLGNGYIGWRGNYEEGMSRPMGVDGCYINGFHETEKIRYGEIAYGYAEESQTMLNVTASQNIALYANGVRLYADQAVKTSRTLNMRTGLLTRETVYAIDGGELTLRSERLVSFDHMHAAAIRWQISANTPCSVRLSAEISGDVTNLVCVDDPRVGSGLKGRVLSAPVMGADGETLGMSQHTGHTHLAVACAMHCTCEGAAQEMTDHDGYAVRRIFDAQLGAQTITLCKIIAYANAAQEEEEKALSDALSYANEAAAIGFDALKAQQQAYMARFWESSGIFVEGDDLLLQGLRFNMYHLLQSAGRDGVTNIAAKGLTGEGYEGHYFWDTETYIFPMFLHVAPEIARALLEYRYSILPFARERAREMGHDTGALYPWRTINGREASAYYPAGTAQVHINADIAFAVKRYWEATGDHAFLYDMGAEIVCETARLYLDLGFYHARKGGKFCINEVTGPDEYNALVNNNAYTNLMAATNMAFAADALDLMRKKAPEKYAALKEKIALRENEAQEWRKAAQNIYVPRDEATGLVWQDDGFMDRKPWPLSSIPKENFPLLLHYHPLVIYRHQICKQADTVLAMLLLPDLFTKEEKETAFRFYDSVTTHDSSLSMAAFSAVASRIGDTRKAYDYFSETARLDLDDTHGNTRDGLHMANMAGTWVCVVTGFGGMKVSRETVSFDPILPDQLKGYGFSVWAHGRLIQVRVSGEGVHYKLLKGESITILDRGAPRMLSIEE
ncbi:MAG: glycoside hydrolase family 65 protein [Clostridia bacterium]|nr:glycoside hydrolase family 65 protein [Clostridia bacterium]